MANYLLLYHGGGMPETEEDKRKFMAAWDEWIKQFGDSLVDVGNPTADVQTVSQSGIAAFFGDRVTGYSIVKADAMEDALRHAQTLPLVDAGGSVDVYETFNAM